MGQTRQAVAHGAWGRRLRQGQGRLLLSRQLQRGTGSGSVSTVEDGSMGTAGTGGNEAQAGSGDQATGSRSGGTGGISSGGEQMSSFLGLTMGVAATGDGGSNEAWAGARAAGDSGQGLANGAGAEVMEVSGNGQITWTTGGIDWARGMDADGRAGLAGGSDGANGADSTGSGTRGMAEATASGWPRQVASHVWGTYHISRP